MDNYDTLMFAGVWLLCVVAALKGRNSSMCEILPLRINTSL